jgi:hypothetical protein
MKEEDALLIILLISKYSENSINETFNFVKNLYFDYTEDIPLLLLKAGKNLLINKVNNSILFFELINKICQSTYRKRETDKDDLQILSYYYSAKYYYQNNMFNEARINIANANKRFDIYHLNRKVYLRIKTLILEMKTFLEMSELSAVEKNLDQLLHLLNNDYIQEYKSNKIPFDEIKDKFLKIVYFYYGHLELLKLNHDLSSVYRTKSLEYFHKNPSKNCFFSFHSSKINGLSYYVFDENNESLFWFEYAFQELDDRYFENFYSEKAEIVHYIGLLQYKIYQWEFNLNEQLKQETKVERLTKKLNLMIGYMKELEDIVISEKPIKSQNKYKALSVIYEYLAFYEELLENFHQQKFYLIKSFDYYSKLNKKNNQEMLKKSLKLANLLNWLGNTSEALVHFEISLNLVKSCSEGLERELELYLQIGICHYSLKNYKDGADCLEKCFSRAIENKSFAEIIANAKLYYSLCLLNIGNSDPNLVIQHLETSLPVLSEFATNDIMHFAYTIFCLGTCHDKLNNRREAYQYYMAANDLYCNWNEKDEDDILNHALSLYSLSKFPGKPFIKM